MARNASALEVNSPEAKGVKDLPPSTGKKPRTIKAGAAKDKPAKASKPKADKPAKAAKPKEEKAPAQKRDPGTRGGYPLTATIHLTEEGKAVGNPHKANGEGGGIRYLAFESVKRAKTVADYQGKPKYLKRWVDAGYITITIK